MDISSLKLYATHEHPCSYLPGRMATTVFIDPDAPVDRRIYSDLSDLGFRRSGGHLYRPHCQNCQACIPLRIPVTEFKATRSQKRCARRNADLKIDLVGSINTDEHYKLYERYLAHRHADGDMYPATRSQYREFLSSEWNATRYIEFRLGHQLVAVAVSDYLDRGISAIYTYFDPAFTDRGLGTFAILTQIEMARFNSLDFVYLGYWIKDCLKMKYKSHFRPAQVYINNRWLTFN